MSNKTANWPFAPKRCPIFYGWPVLAAGTLGVLMSVPGQTMGVSVFTDSLLGVLAMSRTQLSIAYMAGTVASAVLLPYAGRVYDRLGARTAAAAASLSLAAVLLLLSRADVLVNGIALASGVNETFCAFLVMLPLFFALRLCGQGILTLASLNMVAKWFERRRGMAFGISGVFTALGLSSAPMALDSMIGVLGWRGAWMAMAAILAMFFMPLALALYRDNPEACELLPDGRSKLGGNGSDASGPEPCKCLREVRRTAVFWVFSLSLALSALYMTGLTFHIVSVFETAGMTRTNAVSVFLPMSAVAVTVHLSAGWLSDRMALTYLLGLMLFGLGVSMMALILLAPGWPVALLIAGNGLSQGLFALLSAVTWAKLFGRTHLGAISGFNMSIVVFHSALGPILFSQSLSWAGSYSGAGIVGLVCACVLLIGTFWVHSAYRIDSRFRG
ncbi:MAG: MFS transporter [Candidatus Hydrogenedentota bacterium]